MIRWVRCWAALLSLAVALGVPGGAPGQSNPPIASAIFFLNPPANLTFGVGAPIGIAIQIKNTSGSPVYTADGFLETPFWQDLFFNNAGGGTITSGNQTHLHQTLLSCYSRNGVLVGITAIPVLPLEIIPASYATQLNVPDARTYYDLSRPGRYSVNARIPLQTFNVNDPNAVISNCDQFAGIVVNVGAASASQAFMVTSNTLTFCVGYCTFVGFFTPLQNDSSCGKPPCRTFNLGNTIPVKFQLLDASGVPFGGAHATISVVQLKGAPPAIPPTDLGSGTADTGNVFRYDSTSQQYIFNLSTKVLSAGTWQINANLDSGAVQSVQIGLR